MKKIKSNNNNTHYCSNCHSIITGRGASSLCHICVLLGNSRALGKHWKIKDTSKMKAAQNRADVKKRNRQNNIGCKNGMYGKKHSTESKIKIGKSIALAYTNPVIKEKHRKSLIGRVRRTLTEETKKKISMSNKGQKRSKEVCLQISKKAKLRFQSPAARQRARETAIKYPNKKYKNTKIELAIKKELLLRSITFEMNVGIKGIKIVDFYLPKYNIVIVCD